MATLAGMDLGYGSQVKIVRTNYLCLNHIDSAITAQSLANFLQIVQHNSVPSSTLAISLNVITITLDDHAHGGQRCWCFNTW